MKELKNRPSDNKFVASRKFKNTFQCWKNPRKFVASRTPIKQISFFTCSLVHFSTLLDEKSGPRESVVVVVVQARRVFPGTD